MSALSTHVCSDPRCRNIDPAAHKRSDQLSSGDRVVVMGRVRTVSLVRPSGYLNRSNRPILSVIYCAETIEEARSDRPLGNTSHDAGLWKLALAEGTTCGVCGGNTETRRCAGCAS